ncbi:MAG TPA: hypothetical protein VMW03_03000 [Candidatus Krumholzibacteriaceae bacterium]|nr:hypothetical protein [Candidatus Krumholzibacteriaceae bacterium]
MSVTVKKTIPVVIVAVVAFIVMMDYFLLTPPVDVAGKSWTSTTVTNLQNWGVILTAFALGFGAVNLFYFHSKHISRRTPGQWMYSLWLLIVIVIFTGIGVFTGPTSDQYSWLYNASYFALSATVYSSLGFYMTSGLYRALRFKNVESGIFLVVGFIVLARNAPAFAVYFPVLRVWGSFISDVLTTSAQRGIMIGGALGAISLGIRTMTGRETGFLGKLTEEERGGGIE